LDKNFKFFTFISDVPDKDNFRLTIKLGDFISHTIVGKNPDSSALNTLDRSYYAGLFLDEFKNYFKHTNKSVYNAYMISSLYERLKEEIAIYIDLKIPYFYYIKKNDISGHDGKKHYKGIKLVNGKISYKFEKSKDLEKILFNVEEEMATEKQKKYLRDLAKNGGYKVINEKEITKDIVAKLIGFVKDDIDIDIELLNKFLIYE
jgi:hypothetical protein